jgi:hypothetical protein
MAEKKKKLMLTTPTGRAKYPWLNKPNTKFDSNGLYCVTLVLDYETAKPLMETIDQYNDQSYRETKEKLISDGKAGLAKTLKKADSPYSNEVDENGDETGNVEFKFKHDAKFVSKKSGNTFEFKPDLFNSKGERDESPIFGGSLIKVGWWPNLYYVAAQKSCGVSLKLSGVQVIEASQGGGSRDANYYGFKNEASDDDNNTGVNTDDDSEF